MRITTAIILCLWMHIAAGQIDFVDVREAAKIPDSKQNYGVYVADYNNDGWDDIFVTRRSADRPNSLFKNNGDGTFDDRSEDLSDFSKHSNTANWFDFNNDGWLDLFVGNSVREGNKLYRNNRDGFFSDYTEVAGIEGVKDQVKSVNAADLNGDGWLDIYTHNFNEDNDLYLNQGDGTFENVIKVSGANINGHAMGVILFDYDNDMDIDIYATLDGQPFRLFENNGLAQFVDVSVRANANYQGFGMGTDIADLNGDGYFDVYVTNLYENTLLISQGDKTFQNLAIHADVADLGMGWGCNFFDYNNDGLTDLYVTNEYGFSPIENVLYQNDGDLKFSRVVNETLLSPYSGFGSAISDFNKDGKLDILIANSSSTFQLLENNCETGNWLRIKLVDPNENMHAVGSRIRISAEHLNLDDQLTSGSGHASQSSSFYHFGLGTARQAEEVRITWPDGEHELIENLAANQEWLVIRGQGAEPFSMKSFQSIFPSEPLPQPSVLYADMNRDISVFPNPAKAQVTITGSPTNVTLIDLSGKELTLEPWLLEQDRSIYNLSGIPSGLYFLLIDNRRQKLIISE